MNACNEKFLKDKQINLSIEDDKVFFPKDINYIFDKYEIQSSKNTEVICMEDLLGFSLDNGRYSKILTDNLDNFFDSQGDGYHNRSVGLLEYDENNVVEKLLPSFREEPIQTLNVDNGKHVIMTNGMHRFIVLRILYLKAKSKCQTEEEIEKIKKDFMIPVVATKIDAIKTYCKYLINLFQPAPIMNEFFSGKVEEIKHPIWKKNKRNIMLKKREGWNKEIPIYITREEFEEYLASINSISKEYDERWKPTGNSVVKYFNGDEIVLTDEELIEFTKKIICESKHFDQVLKMRESSHDFLYSYNNLASFKNFLETYFSDVFIFDEMGVRKNETYSR